MKYLKKLMEIVAGYFAFKRDVRFEYLYPLLRRFQISSRYGERVDPISGRKSFHCGVDYACPVGSYIVAAHSGVVLRANSHSEYGKMVVMKHSNGEATLYAHLDKILVRPGDEVRKGEIIAISGRSGKVTGPHLHFEIIKPEFAAKINPGVGVLGIGKKTKVNGKMVETRLDPEAYIAEF